MCRGETKAGNRCRLPGNPWCWRHEPAGRNRRAVEVTIEALNGAEFDGTVRVVDEATLELVRSLADQVDADPGNAQMWRQYSEALKGLVPENVSANPRDELMAELRATLVDSEKAGETVERGA